MESNSISILVNRSPLNEFQPKRGLRQGDPPVPFLFLIVVERLSSLIKQVVERNMFESYKVRELNMEVNLL